MRQSLLEHPGGGGTRSSTGMTCDGESANLPSITTAYATHPFSYSTHHQPHHVVGGGGSLGMSLPRPDEHQVRPRGGLGWSVSGPAYIAKGGEGRREGTRPLANLEHFGVH